MSSRSIAFSLARSIVALRSAKSSVFSSESSGKITCAETTMGSTPSASTPPVVISSSPMAAFTASGDSPMYRALVFPRARIKEASMPWPTPSG